MSALGRWWCRTRGVGAARGRRPGTPATNDRLGRAPGMRLHVIQYSADADVAAAFAYWREAGAQWWQDREGPLLAEVAEGAPYGEVLRGHGVTAQAVTGHRRRSPEFARALDAALLAGRDPELSHGSATGWRAGCRCPECREHHERSR